MDLQVSFSARNLIPDVGAFLEAARTLAFRLRLAQRPLHAQDPEYAVGHGFVPMPLETEVRLNEAQRRHFTLHKLRGELYLTESGPLEDNPYYRWRLAMLEGGGPDRNGVLEASGLLLGIHERVWAFEFMAVALEYGRGERVGPFLGGVVSGVAFSQQDVRTGFAGPLAHMQLLEFLTALRREVLPSLHIRDPSGYLESGDVLALLEAMGYARESYAALFEEFFDDPALAERLQGSGGLPVLEGEVGSPARVVALERYLTQSRIPVPELKE